MNDTMLAGVLHGKRDLRLEERRRPELRPGMVLLRVHRVGICGSDLHYFDHGRCGGFVPTNPFVLGHELTGTVAELGSDSTALSVGMRVTVNPARVCGVCEYCRSGRGNLCGGTIMLGSASTKPPTDGAMAEYVVVRTDQCHELPDDVDDGLGAMIEPLAVVLHAMKQAGSVASKRVLVTGGGPIGLLAAMTARAFGAAPVVLSDVVLSRRNNALSLAADAVLDPAAPDVASRVRELTGDGFDVVFEASGAAPALRQAFDLIRRGGTIVQIGTLSVDDLPLPANQIMAREIRFVGSFRYGDVFPEAIRLLVARRIDLRPLISCVLPLAHVDEAMSRALARDHTMKVQISVP
jgi:L-idonate 5-dehydrogenase